MRTQQEIEVVLKGLQATKNVAMKMGDFQHVLTSQYLIELTSWVLGDEPSEELQRFITAANKLEETLEKTE